jgi:hypothetical protein
MVAITPFDQVPQLALVAGTRFGAAGTAARGQEPTHQFGVAPNRRASLRRVEQAAYVGQRVGAIHAGKDRWHLT